MTRLSMTMGVRLNESDQAVENYFNYFTEIEEHFQRRRGGILIEAARKVRDGMLMSPRRVTFEARRIIRTWLLRPGSARGSGRNEKRYRGGG